MVRSRLMARAALLGRVLIKGAMVDFNPTSRNRGNYERNWVDLQT
jgi:hypothetical protein